MPSYDWDMEPASISDVLFVTPCFLLSHPISGSMSKNRKKHILTWVILLLLWGSLLESTDSNSLTQNWEKTIDHVLVLVQILLALGKEVVLPFLGTMWNWLELVGLWLNSSHALWCLQGLAWDACWDLGRA